MERRLLVAGLAVALGSTTVRAAAVQSDEASETPIGEAERHFLLRTRALGALSLALSRIAAKKGDDDDVKEFVQFEIGEQEALADVLHAIEAPGALSGRIRPPSESEAAALLDAKAQDLIQELDRQKLGTPFDQAYIRLQIDGHKQLMEVQIDYLASGRHAIAMAVAKLTRVVVKEHMTLLSDIDAALGRG